MSDLHGALSGGSLSGALSGGSLGGCMSGGLSRQQVNQMIWDILPTDTASGSIASFPDGADNVPVEALSVALEPVQNLHGQSSPYPAGGGKNKFEVIQTTQTISDVTITVNSDGTLTLAGTASAIISLVLGYFTPSANTSYYVSGSPFSSNACRLQFQEGSTTVANQYNNTDTLVENLNATQHRIRLYIAKNTNVNGVVIKPMIRLASVADATFAPYSNICPITAHTQVEVWRAGVNLWDEEWVNGFIDSSGVFTARDDIVGTKNAIPVKPNTTYRFVRPSVRAFITYWKKAESYNELVSTDFISRSARTPGVDNFTTPDNCYAIHFNMVTDYGSSYGSDIAINYPTTNTAYIAHEPIVNISIPLGQTVYGGTLDVVNGVLTVTDANIASYNGETLPSTWISDRDVYSAGETPTIGAQVVYKLAQPIEIPLTPNQITTLLGTNNIWSDSGDVSVEYRADIQRYITKVISEALA